MTAENGAGRGGRKRILLFGTSGNPPTGTGGHSGIVEYFVGTGHYHELWVLPVYRHMFAQKRHLMSLPGSPTFDQRVEMCRLAFERQSSNLCLVEVMRLEEELFQEKLLALGQGATEKQKSKVRVMTYDVLRRVKADHPAVEFSFVLGMDAYLDLRRGKWAHSEELLASLTFVVVARHGVLPPAEQVPQEVSVHHLPDLTGVSSTALRNTDRKEELSEPSVLDEQVLEYIRREKLYCYGRPRLLRRAAYALAAAARQRPGTAAAAAVLVGAAAAAALWARAGGKRGGGSGSRGGGEGKPL